MGALNQTGVWKEYFTTADGDVFGNSTPHVNTKIPTLESKSQQRRFASQKKKNNFNKSTLDTENFEKWTLDPRQSLSDP